MSEQGKRTAVSEAFVVFSDDWGEHLSSCQHLFRHLAKRHPVVWVNTIGMRRPRLSWTDVRKAYRKLSGMLRPGRASDAPAGGPNVTVCQPLMLPFSNISAVRILNARSVARAVRLGIDSRGITAPVLVTTVPNACDYLDDFRDATVVYYCVDDFSEWPGLDKALVRTMENRLIARADILVATSKKLYDRLLKAGKPTHLLAHGVDVELFSRQAPLEHTCLARIPRPRAGFFGLFDARSDQDLIAAVAARLPEFAFVITGPVEVDVSKLRAQRNIHFTGAVNYQELPALIKGLEVLFIPYRSDDFADTLSPLKLKEYLVTGKPIVSTPIAAARAHADYLAIAATADDWEVALQNACKADVDARRERILRTMAGESWAQKAETLRGICGADGIHRVRGR